MSIVRWMLFALVAVSPFAGLSDVLAQPLVPLGGEFQVNTYTTGGQYFTSVAVGGTGGFIVAWTREQDGSGAGIVAQRYDNTGAALGGEFLVNDLTTGTQTIPSVAADQSGNFVVVWSSGDGPGPDAAPSFSIQARRYDSSGTPQGGQFQVNTYTTADQSFGTVACDPAGNFVVTWSSPGQDGDLDGIFAQRYDNNGMAQGGEFQVNTYTTGSQFAPSVGMDAGGNFVVAWSSYGSAGTDTSFRSVQAQRYDANGAALGGEFQVNTYTTGSQPYSWPGGPRVAADPTGNFIVVWTSTSQDGASVGVVGQRYDNNGMAQGGEFQVNTYTTGYQRYPHVAVDGAGSFIVAWESPGQDGESNGVFAQRYDSSAIALGGEFQVNTYTTGPQGLINDPVVASDPAGNFVVVWTSLGSAGSDTSSSSVQAQRFASGRPILGKKLLVKDPTGSEDKRTVIALAKETATDIGATVLGNPTTAGATLRVITNGTTPSDQTYALDASGWSTLGSAGYKYSGPTGGDDDPVKKVLVKRTPGGTALVKAIIKGNVGTQSLDVVPPNLGDDGGFILTIPGGGTYCAAFGGAAGGTEVKDTAQLWKVTNATAQDCPTTP